MNETETMTKQEKAAEALSWFTTRKRGDRDEESIIVIKDDAPEWVSELVRHAHHGVTDMLPDDYRYSFVSDALATITNEDEEDYGQAVDADVDIYNADLYRWLASNLIRGSYVDEATEETGHAPTIAGDIALGQYREREEVLELVLEFLTEMGEDA